jgi:hypothetical protein
VNNNINFLEILKKEIIRDECENIVVKEEIYRESKIENVQGWYSTFISYLKLSTFFISILSIIGGLNRGTRILLIH